MKYKSNNFSNAMFNQQLFKLLWGGCETNSLGEKTLSQPLPNGCVFPFCQRDF